MSILGTKKCPKRSKIMDFIVRKLTISQIKSTHQNRQSLSQKFLQVALQARTRWWSTNFIRRKSV